MPYSSFIKHAWLNEIRGGGNGVNFVPPAAIYASLHDADPGDTGTDEISGGAPAYARQEIEFGAAAAGAIDSSTAPVFDVPAGTTVSHVGFWDDPTAGNFLGYADVVDEIFGSQGTYTLTDADLDLNA